MAYEFTHHAQRRLLEKGLRLEQAQELFEKAVRVDLKNEQRKNYKMAKYGLEYLSTEYYYNDGKVFVCLRENTKLSKILTVFTCDKKDLTFYNYGRRPTKSKKGS